MLHKISIREFAEIFGISKSHAEEILNHRKLPALDLAIRIARYWECSVEELFGWRVDDDGARRPLVVAVSAKHVVRLSRSEPRDSALAIVSRVRESLEEQCTTSE
jgi:transcriptional regulator with XRE-family HTH domain